MTTASATVTTTAVPLNRTLNVVRMQLVNRQTFIWIPLIVLAAALAISLMIGAILIRSGLEGVVLLGGNQAPLWYFLVVGIQALTLTFPFSQAMSVTRREFYLGTLLTAACSIAALAVLFLLTGRIEQITDGWGINAYFSYLPWLWADGAAVAGLLYFAVGMLLFITGFVCATIYKRGGPLALVLALTAYTLALVGAIWLITVTENWPAVGEWIASLGILGLALWALALSAVLALVSYGVLRRAIP